MVYVREGVSPLQISARNPLKLLTNVETCHSPREGENHMSFGNREGEVPWEVWM